MYLFTRVDSDHRGDTALLGQPVSTIVRPNPERHIAPLLTQLFTQYLMFPKSPNVILNFPFHCSLQTLVIMAVTISNLFIKLKGHLAHTKAKLYQPDEPNYKQIEQCFIDKPVETLGVVKPQDADEVASVLQFCLENHVEFSVRSGGHDCASRTLVDGALVIDMRDINYVVVSEDKQSARVGGGVLIGQLAKTLSEDGLATPV